MTSVSYESSPCKKFFKTLSNNLKIQPWLVFHISKHTVICLEREKIKGTVHSQHSTFLFFSSNSLNAKSLNYFSRKKSYTLNHNSLKEWLIQPLQKWLPIATQQFFSLPLSISIEDSLVTENGRTIEVWSCISDWDLHRIDIHCSKEVEC